ncbi:MAG TPA: MBL fold metallo-hydrolase, partial [Planctomycetota bacterium]|nr:MBL fold metallo-hydrolase [Planctomycetota bacterium]
THADADHYMGLQVVPWTARSVLLTLDHVAGPMAAPGYHRTPRLLPQPVDIDRVAHDGETVPWNEYELTFHHLPAPTRFGSAVETLIDGKRVLFAGDAFLHPDQDPGCGGWSGLNGSLPDDYAACAAKVLELKPDYVLASRGGPFGFSAEDWERRVRWAQEAGRACDRLSPSGNHRRDWDPQAVRVEPYVSRAAAGEAVSLEFVARNRLDRTRRIEIVLDGRGRVPSERRTLVMDARGTARALLTLRVSADAPKGRHAFPLRVLEDGAETGDDAAFLIDVN